VSGASVDNGPQYDVTVFDRFLGATTTTATTTKGETTTYDDKE
jgi:hypothetical protein